VKSSLAQGGATSEHTLSIRLNLRGDEVELCWSRARIFVRFPMPLSSVPHFIGIRRLSLNTAPKETRSWEAFVSPFLVNMSSCSFQITFPRPLRSTRITKLQHYYGPSDCYAPFSSAHSSPYFFHVNFHTSHLQPSIQIPRPLESPYSASMNYFQASPRGCGLAICTNRNQFALLHAVCSPPVAPHPRSP
jgi:hypothetical protein